jgi:hypothetical protein
MGEEEERERRRREAAAALRERLRIRPADGFVLGSEKVRARLRKGACSAPKRCVFDSEPARLRLRGVAVCHGVKRGWC